MILKGLNSINLTKSKLSDKYLFLQVPQFHSSVFLQIQSHVSITDIYWRVSIYVRGIDVNDTTGCLEFWIFDIPQSIIRIHYEVSILANVGKLHYSNSHKYPFVWLLNNTMQRGNLMFFKYSFKIKSIENHPTKFRLMR